MTPDPPLCERLLAEIATLTGQPIGAVRLRLVPPGHQCAIVDYAVICHACPYSPPP